MVLPKSKWRCSYQVMIIALAFGLGFVWMSLPQSQATSNDTPIQVSSTEQLYEPLDGRTSFQGNVKVALEGTEITGQQANIQMDKDGKATSAVFNQRSRMVKKNGNQQTVIQADNMNMGLQDGSLQAQGKVVTQMAGDPKSGDVFIQSDTQIFDQDKHLMRAIGHVVVKRQDLSVTSPEAIVFMAESGGVEKVLFIKGANLSQGEQQMSAESITIKLDSGDIFAEKDTKSIVDGKDSQGKPTKVRVQSYLQEWDKDTGTLFANGNAIVHYDDYLAKGPKAVFYRINNDLDHIVLTGRAQIEDDERKVTGDKVTITVNPRQFNAEGNVTTFIKANKQNQAASTSQPATPPSKATSQKTSGAKRTPANTSKSAVASQATSGGTAVSPWDQEVMIEKATQGGGPSK